MPKDDWAKAKRSDIARRASRTSGQTTHSIYMKWLKRKQKQAQQAAKPKPAPKPVQSTYLGRTPCKVYFDNTTQPPTKIQLANHEWIWPAAPCD